MRDKSCKKCIHFGCCMDWQHIQDENLQQRTTTEEDFIQCVNCEDCQFYLDAEIITRQQAEIENLKVENQSLRGAANSLKMHYEEAQAKIDKLNAENMLTMSERNAFLTSFNEVSKRLKSQKHALFEQQSYTADLQKQLKTAKSKAVKEFAERLKELDGYDNHIFDDCASLLVSEEYKKGRYEKTNEIWSTIDNLVKEMVGENNG